MSRPERECGGAEDSWVHAVFAFVASAAQEFEARILCAHLQAIVVQT
jgi:hypothetical protein